MAGWRNKKASEPSAYQRALGLLVRREHSRKELGRKLSAKGVEREDAELALDKLNKQDFQSDGRFAVALARSRANAGYGPQRIRSELATHALARDEIADALEACARDWDASARDIVARRYGNKNLGDPGLRRKVVDFLLRRGFEQKSAYAAVRAGAVDEEFGD